VFINVNNDELDDGLEKKRRKEIALLFTDTIILKLIGLQVDLCFMI